MIMLSARIWLRFVLAVAVYNHYKRITQKVEEDNIEIEKSNCLLLGKTGTKVVKEFHIFCNLVYIFFFEFKSLQIRNHFFVEFIIGVVITEIIATTNVIFLSIILTHYSSDFLRLKYMERKNHLLHHSTH